MLYRHRKQFRIALIEISAEMQALKAAPQNEALGLLKTQIPVTNYILIKAIRPVFPEWVTYVHLLMVKRITHIHM